VVSQALMDRAMTQARRIIDPRTNGRRLVQSVRRQFFDPPQGLVVRTFAVTILIHATLIMLSVVVPVICGTSIFAGGSAAVTLRRNACQIRPTPAASNSSSGPYRLWSSSSSVELLSHLRLLIGIGGHVTRKSGVRFSGDGLATAYAGAVQAAIEILWAFDGRDAAWGHLVKCALAMTLAMLGSTASAFLAGGLGVPSFSVQ
jgi:hypothetical protein